MNQIKVPDRVLKYYQNSNCQPIPLETIEQWEQIVNIKLPSQLRYFLINIAGHWVINKKTPFINLDNLNMDNIDNLQLEDWYNEIQQDFILGTKDEDKTTLGCLYIGGTYNYIVVKGKHENLIVSSHCGVEQEIQGDFYTYIQDYFVPKKFN